MYVGNDVIDLTDPETTLDALRELLMDSAFDPRERDEINADRDPRAAMWIRWAAKQSAFKALRKVERDAGVDQQRLRVDFFNRVGGTRLMGLVEYEGHRLDVDVAHVGQTIHAIALLGQSPNGRRVVADVVPAGASEKRSATAREALLCSVAGELACAPSELRVVGSAPPRLEHRGAASGIDASLSHHGRLSAFAYAPPHRSAVASRPTAPWSYRLGGCYQ